LTSNRVTTALAVACGLAISACAFDEIEVPRTTPTVVVHSVLNPSTLTQVLLLERTLTGAVTVRDSVFDPTNPIASAGGVPISGATVELVDSTGRVVRAVEDRTGTTSQGTGVYRFLLTTALRLGARYELRIRTLEGENVTAETRLPRPVTTTSGALTRTFNRDHDTLIVQWDRAAGARAYALRVESPFGPFFFFNDSTHFRLTGDLRNLFSSDLRRVLVPGFRQDVIAAGVDSNFYDYYRTQNDPFTGSGIINRIQGGIGLFGSLVTMTSGTLTVTADQTEPVEGRFRATPNPADLTVPLTLNLYIESKSLRPDLPSTLSGRYTTSPPNARSDGLVGTLFGTHVTFAVLVNQLASDTLDVFVGELSGNTITGSYRRRVTETIVYVRQ
jgi:hypothetical protein